MKYASLLVTLVIFLSSSCAQVPADRPHLQNPDFDRRVTQLIDFSVPVMSVEELAQQQDQVYIFDTRKAKEYQISHIPGARFLGYKDFDAARLEGVPKDATIVLYCSVGYRSEKIGKKLQKLGYTQVFNLFGSLFEWVNQGYLIVDQNDQPTNKVHTYNRKWSKWVEEGKAQKVW